MEVKKFSPPCNAEVVCMWRSWMHLSECNSIRLKWGLLSWFRHEKGVVL